MSSYTSSSLTLRSLLKSAGSRLRLGLPARKVSGLTGPAKALFAAAAAERGLTLLVVPTDGGRRDDDGAMRGFSSLRSKASRTPRSNEPSSRSPRTRSIRIAGWRRISISRRRVRVRCTP